MNVANSEAEKMTQAEARKKWCPFVRNLFSDEDGAAAYNRCYLQGNHVDELSGAKCVASDCMMWNGKDCGLKHPRLEVR